MSLLPRSLLHNLESVPGFDSAAFEAVHASGEQVTSIRLNPAKPVLLDDEWVIAGQVPWCPHGRYLASRPSFTLDPRLHAGAYYVQEASSMFLWHALEKTAGETMGKKVLDLCAAPGGKSSLLASYFQDGLLVSNEVIKPRVNILAENLSKWGRSHVIVTNNDPAHFQALENYFDVMVVDAPCSGSGLFRKDPGAIAEWSEANVLLCSQRQQRILADALPALKEDGLLIYATCSYSPEEDEQIADWLCSKMEMESIALDVPAEWGIVETVSSETAAYGYRFYPDRLKGEGFFMAVFRKKTGSSSGYWKEQSLPMASKQEAALINDFIPMPASFSLFKQADSIRTIEQQWLAALQVLAKALYIRKAGIEIGAIKGKDLVPAHELALGSLPLDKLPGIELNKEQALQYLRRKDFSADAVKGWNLIRYCGLPLGWVKVLPNRINNYYPAEWRILKE
jgi:16S rRNA C967 or C1407 C5-methylase (RsmB/RsmF family)/NOL1/NOP2/fmu family ribosome biogenesis protein